MISHQSQLAPVDNKFHAGNGSDGKHYWLTPPELYTVLNAEFHFDFDPCPHPLPDGFDGLTCEWGRSNYVNPPFGSIVHQGKKKGPTAWVRKAIEEHRKGKTVVLVYPVDKWVLMLLKEIGASVRNLGDVRWLATEDGSAGKGTGRHIACFILAANEVMMANRSGPQEPKVYRFRGMGILDHDTLLVKKSDYDTLRAYANACEALLARFVLMHDDEPANYAQVEQLCAEARTFLTARAAQGEKP